MTVMAHKEFKDNVGLKKKRSFLYVRKRTRLWDFQLGFLEEKIMGF